MNSQIIKLELKQRLNRLGWLLLGLSLGLSDELMQYGDGACYQFPYMSHFGCLSKAYSWEIAFVLILISAALISI